MDDEMWFDEDALASAGHGNDEDYGDWSTVESELFGDC
jgi:hypothetical protein